MGEGIKQLGLTSVVVIIAYIGGRKTDGYLMGIYGGSYCLGSFVQWLFPKVDAFNNWVTWIESVAEKAGSFF